MSEEPVSLPSVIASYLVKVTIRSEDTTDPPTVEYVEKTIQATLADSYIGPGSITVRASAERTDI